MAPLIYMKGRSSLVCTTCFHVTQHVARSADGIAIMPHVMAHHAITDIDLNVNGHAACAPWLRRVVPECLSHERIISELLPCTVYLVSGMTVLLHGRLESPL